MRGGQRFILVAVAAFALTAGDSESRNAEAWPTVSGGAAVQLIQSGAQADQWTGATGLWDTVGSWVDSRWRLVSGWKTYEWRSRPGAAVSLWVGSGLHRLGAMVVSTSEPSLSQVDFGVLAVEPVAGAQSSGYGYRIHPITKRRKFHKGVDFKAKRGTPVNAAGPGVVKVARRRGTYGKLVIISHGMGLETRYAHLSRIKVEEGQFVPAGTLIGLVGSTGRSTGPHLHFEVRQFSEPVDPHWAMGRSQQSITDELVGIVSWLAPKKR